MASSWLPKITLVCWEKKLKWQTISVRKTSIGPLLKSKMLETFVAQLIRYKNLQSLQSFKSVNGHYQPQMSYKLSHVNNFRLHDSSLSSFSQISTPPPVAIQQPYNLKQYTHYPNESNFSFPVAQSNSMFTGANNSSISESYFLVFNGQATIVQLGKKRRYIVQSDNERSCSNWTY